MARCAHRYGSGDQCVFTGCKEEGDFCPAHNHLKQTEATQQRYRERQTAAKPPREPKPKKERAARPSPPPPLPPPPLPPPPPPEPVVREPLSIGRPGDPSAPYCTCANRTADPNPCTSCGKPHFMDWRSKVGARASL